MNALTKSVHNLIINLAIEQNLPTPNPSQEGNTAASQPNTCSCQLG
jgi:hypothetical protein